MDHASNEEVDYLLEEANSNTATSISNYYLEEASSNAATNICGYPLEKSNSNVATNISIMAKWSFTGRVFIFLGIQFFATTLMVGIVN